MEYIILDICSLAVVSRSVRNGVKLSIVELAHIERAHLGRSFRASFVCRTVAMCPCNTIIQLYFNAHTLTG